MLDSLRYGSLENNSYPHSIAYTIPYRYMVYNEAKAERDKEYNVCIS